MSSKNGPHGQYEDTFKQSAVEFLSKHGSNVEAAAEVGAGPAGPQTSQRKLGERNKTVKTLSGMARLRAENEALRHQIVSLQGQWDILKSTLGMLSTTVCSRETV